MHIVRFQQSLVQKIRDIVIKDIFCLNNIKDNDHFKRNQNNIHVGRKVLKHFCAARGHVCLENN